MPDNDIRLAYLARIASLYYDQHKTQQDIADALGITRSAVSRLITEAHDRGIVEITVHYPWTSNGLEQELVATFGLKAARVMVREDRSYEEMLSGLGKLAAQYLNGILSEKTVIGISWGTALYQMIQQLPARQLPEAEVVQLIGATGSERIPTDGPMLAQLLTERLGCACRYLHAPLIVENEVVRDSLLQQRSIRETLARAQQADVALVGIGSTHSDLNSLLRAGYINEKELRGIRAAGAIGDICAQHYSASGEWLDIEINRRAIGIDLSHLSHIRTVIGVAGDERKSAAILGALRGKYVSVLITDDHAAHSILERCRKAA